MNMPMLSAALLSILCIATPGQAHDAGHGPHEHGVARMDVAVDNSSVEIDLESPLANALAFEHAPRTDAERNAASAMAAALRNAEKIFVLPSAAQCRLEKVSLSSGQLPPDMLGEKQDENVSSAAAPAQGGHTEHDEHGDLDASFTFACAKPEALRTMDVRLFAAWPALHTLHVQMVTPAGQRAAELTPESHTLAW